MSVMPGVSLRPAAAVNASVAYAAQLRSMALAALPRMYRPEAAIYAFRLRRTESEPMLEGESERYTAIVLIGLADGPANEAALALDGQDPLDVCGKLIRRIEHASDMGAVALTLWAARRWQHPDADRAQRKLRSMEPVGGAHPTVQIAWALTSQMVGDCDSGDRSLADDLAKRLMDSFEPRSALFPHWPQAAAPSALRAHVTCFADLVYPTQALAYYAQKRRDNKAADMARRCADQACALQGPRGEWWWHYDVRTGRVIEGYPVYAVHQDSMGPMALLALRRIGALETAHEAALWRGVEWLRQSPLVDTGSGIIWRKVCRHEPGKLVRAMQAGASRLHSRLRMPGVDWIFRPGRVDWESRPYHMGWILHAFGPIESEKM